MPLLLILCLALKEIAWVIQGHITHMRVVEVPTCVVCRLMHGCRCGVVVAFLGLERSSEDHLGLATSLDGSADDSLLVRQGEVGQRRGPFASSANMWRLRQLFKDKVDLCLTLSFIEAELVSCLVLRDALLQEVLD